LRHQSGLVGSTAGCATGAAATGAAETTAAADAADTAPDAAALLEGGPLFEQAASPTIASNSARFILNPRAPSLFKSRWPV
jgi:hypothetical protein